MRICSAAKASTSSSDSSKRTAAPTRTRNCGDLEVIPKRRIDYRGVVLEEMDLDAIIARKPQLCVVDEIAHSNVAGSRHEKRYQDVLELLDAGISVMGAVNIQHIESLNDAVGRDDRRSSARDRSRYVHPPG